MDRCIIVQGPTYENSIDKIKKCWENFPVIYSTWKGYEEFYNEENVIFSDLPPIKGVQNMNYQKESTIAGLLRAKELGYTRALKIRSDMWVKNADLFFSKLTDGYNTLMWVEYNGGYLTDYWMEDSIENLLTLWDVPIHGPFPERILTNKILNLGWIERVNLLLTYLDGENLDIFWNGRHGTYWQHILKKEDQYKTNETWKRNDFINLRN